MDRFSLVKNGEEEVKAYLYETHLHTSPLSNCAGATVRETLEFYESAGYAGVFLTDHFIDGNIDLSLRQLPYKERIEAYFGVHEEAISIGKELGIDVFSAFEMSYHGTDFLVYGIGKEWCLAHEDMDKMKKSELLSLLKADGALLIHAHPFRESKQIDHFRLYPRQVDGVEVFNAGRSDFENGFAEHYTKYYDLIRFAGSDNHTGKNRELFGGMATEEPIKCDRDFIDAVLSGRAKPFVKDRTTLRFI